MSRDATPEAALCRAYAAMAAGYAGAMHAAEELAAACRRGEDGAEHLAAVLAAVRAAAGIEADLVPVKRAWAASGRQPGPELHASRARLQEAVGRLGCLVRAAEEAARERQAALAAELDATLRGRRMLSAYGAARLREVRQEGRA